MNRNFFAQKDAVPAVAETAGDNAGQTVWAAAGTGCFREADTHASLFFVYGPYE